jgi:hypothetical protein
MTMKHRRSVEPASPTRQKVRVLKNRRENGRRSQKAETRRVLFRCSVAEENIAAVSHGHNRAHPVNGSLARARRDMENKLVDKKVCTCSCRPEAVRETQRRDVTVLLHIKQKRRRRRDQQECRTSVTTAARQRSTDNQKLIEENILIVRGRGEAPRREGGQSITFL